VTRLASFQDPNAAFSERRTCFPPLLTRPVSKAGQKKERAAYGVRQEDCKTVQGKDCSPAGGAPRRGEVKNENGQGSGGTEIEKGRRGDGADRDEQAEREQDEFESRGRGEKRGRPEAADGEIRSRTQQDRRSAHGRQREKKSARRSDKRRFHEKCRPDSICGKERGKVGQDHAACCGLRRQINNAEKGDEGARPSREPSTDKQDSIQREIRQSGGCRA